MRWSVFPPLRARPQIVVVVRFLTWSLLSRLVRSVRNRDPTMLTLFVQPRVLRRTGRCVRKSQSDFQTHSEFACRCGGEDTRSRVQLLLRGRRFAVIFVAVVRRNEILCQRRRRPWRMGKGKVVECAVSLPALTGALELPNRSFTFWLVLWYQVSRLVANHPHRMEQTSLWFPVLMDPASKHVTRTRCRQNAPVNSPPPIPTTNTRDTWDVPKKSTHVQPLTEAQPRQVAPTSIRGIFLIGDKVELQLRMDRWSR